MNLAVGPSVDVLLLAGRTAFLVFSFVIAAISFTAWRRATRQQTEEVLAQSQSLLQRLAALETRLDDTAVVVARIDERSERQMQLSGTATGGYQIAIRLARGGASREELVSRCGLSFGEAELVRRLHGASARASA